MPMIYRRFTEKAAEEWRQIYKALQLLEFLIKHGSERVIDDARNHLTLLKMLRQFHYIDQNGKDQGINVRNRAKELTELLSDVDRIRSERKKARVSKNKYVGVEGGAGLGGGFSSGSSSRYGGFGSESAGANSDTFGGYSGGVYGDGGGFGGQTNDYSSSSRRDKFEEYDEFDGDRPTATSSSSSSRAKRERSTPKHRTAEAPKPKPQKAHEVDLFSFDDPVPSSSSAAAAAAPAASSFAALSATPASAPVAAAEDDDEFDDFQSAAPAAAAPAASSGAAFGGLSMAAPTMASPTIAAPKPVSAPQQANLGNMMSMASISPAPSSSGTPAANYSSFSIPMGTAPVAAPAAAAAAPISSGPNYFSSVQAMKPLTATSTGGGMAAIKPVMTGGANKPAAAGSTSVGGDAFGALWSQASSNLAKKPAQSQAGPSMGQLAKEKSSAGIWGAAGGSSMGSPTAAAKPQGASGSASNDLADLLG